MPSTRTLRLMKMNKSPEMEKTMVVPKNLASDSSYLELLVEFGVLTSRTKDFGCMIFSLVRPRCLVFKWLLVRIDILCSSKLFCLGTLC